MIAHLDGRQNAQQAENQSAPDGLPYSIELWESDGTEPATRVLARASNASLARAIFKAAQVEHPDRRITVSRGRQIVADSEL